MKIQKSNLGYRGYIFSRRIEGSLIPQRVQNLVIRDYAEQKKILFKLSATEYKMVNCYVVLENVLKELNSLDGMIFYSLYMLPKDHKTRNLFFNKIIVKKKKLHFALENITASNKKDFLKIETILKIKQITLNN